jgi:hypothetical protein
MTEGKLIRRRSHGLIGRVVLPYDTWVQGQRKRCCCAVSDGHVRRVVEASVRGCCG